jgi:hypothetical protein
MLISGYDYNISCSDSYGDGWNDAEFKVGDLVLIDSSTGSFSNNFFSISIDDVGNVYDLNGDYSSDDSARSSYLSYNLTNTSEE